MRYFGAGGGPVLERITEPSFFGGEIKGFVGNISETPGFFGRRGAGLRGEGAAWPRAKPDYR